jgi:hypothetical protein
VTSHLIRWGGLAGLVAGVMFVLAAILILVAPPQRVFTSFSNYLIEVILVLAFALTLPVAPWSAGFYVLPPTPGSRPRMCHVSIEEVCGQPRSR